MPEQFPADSVGLVTPQSMHFDQPLELDCGRELPSYDLVYETYGELNDDASKAYVATRQGNSVISLNVAGPSSDTGVAGGTLSCPGPDGQSTSDPARCIVDRVPNQDGGSLLPSDPFGLSVDTIRPTNPDTGQAVPIDLVSVAYLASENVSTIAFPNRSIEGATMESAALLPGANAIERRPGTRNCDGVPLATDVLRRQRLPTGQQLVEPRVLRPGAFRATVRSAPGEYRRRTGYARSHPISTRSLYRVRERLSLLDSRLSEPEYRSTYFPLRAETPSRLHAESARNRSY